jgi:hypothetical protein
MTRSGDAMFHKSDADVLHDLTGLGDDTPRYDLAAIIHADLSGNIQRLVHPRRGREWHCATWACTYGSTTRANQARTSGSWSS